MVRTQFQQKERSMKRLWIIACACCLSLSAFAYPSLTIHANLQAFVGAPTWTVILRDLEHNQNIPFVLDFTNPSHFWTLHASSHNYLVQSSTLTFNKPNMRPIYNFCSLESDGKILRGKSITVQLSGRLSPRKADFKCQTSFF